MLKKLVKYEFQATSRMMLLLYAALFVISGVARLAIGNMKWNRGPMYLNAGASVLVVGLYALLICAVVVGTFIMIVYRFYKNLLLGEGYLMNTLPVKSWQHITAKLVTGVVWTLLSIVAVMLSVTLLVGTEIFDILHQINLSSWLSGMGARGVYVFVMAVILILVVITANVLQFYASLSIGQTQDKYKIVISVAVYVAMSILFEIIAALLLWSGVNVADHSLMDLAWGNFQMIESVEITVAVVYQIAKCVILFVISNYFLKNKLNLE